MQLKAEGIQAGRGCQPVRACVRGGLLVMGGRSPEEPNRVAASGQGVGQRRPKRGWGGAKRCLESPLWSGKSQIGPGPAAGLGLAGPVLALLGPKRSGTGENIYGRPAGSKGKIGDNIWEILGKFSPKNNLKKRLTPPKKRVIYALVARENDSGGWPRETAARGGLKAPGRLALEAKKALSKKSEKNT